MTSHSSSPETSVLLDALKSISKNMCCDNCREAALVARKALDAYAELAREPAQTPNREKIMEAITALVNDGQVGFLSVRHAYKIADAIAAIGVAQTIVPDALVKAEAAFEYIRLTLINHLNEPERSAFWKAVEARDAIRAAVRQSAPVLTATQNHAEGDPALTLDCTGADTSLSSTQCGDT